MHGEDNPEQIKLAEELCTHLTEYEPKLGSCQGIWCIIRHVSNDGRELSIRKDGTKYKVHTIWPRQDGFNFTPDDHVNTNINVGAKRGSEALANEIQRRLIPQYHEHYSIQLGKRDASINFEKSELALRDEVLSTLGDSVASHQATSKQIGVYRHGMRQVSISSGKVKLETDYLPKDVAFAILQILKEKMPH